MFHGHELRGFVLHGLVIHMVLTKRFVMQRTAIQMTLACSMGGCFCCFCVQPGSVSGSHAVMLITITPPGLTVMTSGNPVMIGAALVSYTTRLSSLVTAAILSDTVMVKI